MSKFGYSGRSMIPVGIGKQLDDLMYRNNINCNQLANALGINRKTIYRIFDNKNVSVGTIIKIADFFNVSIDYLVFGRDRNAKCNKTN